MKSRWCHLCGKTDSICFSFPTQNVERRKDWLLFCNIDPNSHSISVPFLCKKHFDPKFILKKEKKTVLHGYAVPTIRVESSCSSENDNEPRIKKNVKNCCVCGPTDSHLHRFPKDEVRRNEWLDVLNMKEDKRKDLRLCNIHFPDDYVLKTPMGRMVLKCGAKPKPVLIERKLKKKSSEPNSTDNETTFTFNPITLTNVRQSLSQLCNSERVDAVEVESPKRLNPVAVESNNATGHISTPTTSTSTSARRIIRYLGDITPTTSTSTSARRIIRYLGDINTPSMESPTTRKKCLSVIRKHRSTYGKKVKRLQQETTRLKNKITNLKTLVTDLKKKNFITESAATTLLVNLSHLDFPN